MTLTHHYINISTLYAYIHINLFTFISLILKLIKAISKSIILFFHVIPQSTSYFLYNSSYKVKNFYIKQNSLVGIRSRYNKINFAIFLFFISKCSYVDYVIAYNFNCGKRIFNL